MLKYSACKVSGNYDDSAVQDQNAPDQPVTMVFREKNQIGGKGQEPLFEYDIIIT